MKHKSTLLLKTARITREQQTLVPSMNNCYKTSPSILTILLLFFVIHSSSQQNEASNSQKKKGTAHSLFGWWHKQGQRFQVEN